MMQIQLSNIAAKWIQISMICITCLFTLIGCGGGSSGTDGGHEFRISGLIYDQDGTPLDSAQVSVLETGDQTLTDSEGKFFLPTHSTQSQITLLVEFNTNSARTVIENLPLYSAQVEVFLSFSASQGSLTISNLSLTPLVPSEPTPQTTAAPSPVPTTEPVNPEFKSQILGTIIDTKSLPLAGVSLRIAGQNQSVVTNSRGKFTLEFPAGEDHVVLNLKYQKLKGSVRISKLPKIATRINVTLRLEIIPPKDTNPSGDPSVNNAKPEPTLKVSITSLSA